MESYKIFIDSASKNCEVSLIDSSRIYHYMLENGHKITDTPIEADFIIINSCGFIKAYEDITIGLFNKYNSQKKENAKIVIFGCLIKINKKLVNSLDAYLIDLNQGDKFDEIFYQKVKFQDIEPCCDAETKEKLKRKNDIHQTKYPFFYFTKLISHFSKKLKINYQKTFDNVANKNRIFIEISKGCTGSCSYCVIKKARGNINSRSIKDIISDIGKINDPSKILYLVANDCGCYGTDIKTNLIELLFEINKEFPDLSIELDYLNPFLMEKYFYKYVELFKETNIKFVTIPIQSGSNKVLKKMNRNYNVDEVVNVIDEIKKASPKTFIYSHFIVGFPGENWFDFLKNLTCATHSDFPITFGYSERRGTKSSFLPKKKSDFTIFTRYILSTLFFNFIIFYKLLSYSKYQT